MDGPSANHFQSVHMNKIPVVEDLLTLNILLHDISTVDGTIIGDIAGRSVHKYEITVQLLSYNNHIYHRRNIKANFQPFRCPNCDIFFNRTLNLEPHLTTSSE